jgi:hypothetical protein
MRISRNTSVLSVVLAALWLGAAAPAWSQPAPAADAAQQADEHFRQGKALHKAGKKREAREEYLAAFRLKKSHDVAGNLGNVELSLGMARDAAEHLSFAIRHYAPTGTTPEQIEKAKQRLAEAKRQIGTVTVTVNVPGAEVLVDGASAGHAPLEGELFVEPGTRTISARLAGHEEAKKVVEAGKGTEEAVTLKLVPIGPVDGPPPLPTGSATVVPPPAGGPKREVLIAGGSVAGAALVAGIGLVVGSNGKKADADMQRASLQKLGVCPVGPIAAQCKDLRDKLGTASTLHNVGIGLFVGAAAAGAATAVYGIVASKQGAPARDATPVRVVPAVSNAGGSILIIGTF